MDYKEKYEQALRVAKENYDKQPMYREGLKKMFPELSESEDEEIRKELIDFTIKANNGVTSILVSNYDFNKWLAWLKKQGNNKPAKSIAEAWKDMRLEVYQQASGNRHEPNYSDDTTKMFSLNDIDEIIEKLSEQKSVYAMKQKFHEGEWVIDKQGIVHQISNVIENVTNHTYSYDIVGGGYFNDNTEGVRLWSIQDAKDGDVLATEPIDSYPFPFVAIYKEHCLDFFNSHCFIGFNGKFYDGENGHSIENIHPATKEQRDLLFQKMKEAGYEWDFKKKDLKKIKQINEVKPKFSYGDRVRNKKSGVTQTLGSCIEDVYEGAFPFRIKEQDDWELVEQKPAPAWSEEDSYYRNCIIHIIEEIKNAPLKRKEDWGAYIKWLKSLKDRVLPQPKQEWSKEDEKNLKKVYV